MRVLVVLLSILLTHSFMLIHAQTPPNMATNATATITDTDAQTWNNGTWSAQLNNPSGTQQPVYTLTGQTVQTSIQNQVLSATGILTFAFPDNLKITPSGTRWNITICPDASSPCNTTYGVLVTGATIDLTAALSTNLAPPRFDPGSNARGYNDGEVLLPVKGSMYYNVTSLTLRQYNGTTWSNAGGGGGSVGPGAPNNIGTFNATGTGLIDSGASLTGVTTSGQQPNPLSIGLGNAWGGPAHGVFGNLKLTMWAAGTTDAYGIGMSAATFEYQAGTSGQHAFYVNTVPIVTMTTGGFVVRNGGFAVIPFAGTGSRCIHTDLNGTITPTTADCGVGLTGTWAVDGTGYGLQSQPSTSLTTTPWIGTTNPNNRIFFGQTNVTISTATDMLIGSANRIFFRTNGGYSGGSWGADGLAIWSARNSGSAAVVATNGSSLDVTNNLLASGTANVNSAQQDWTAHFWNGSASTDDYWSVVNTIGTGTTPTSTLTFNHAGSTGTARVAFNTPITVAGDTYLSVTGCTLAQSTDAQCTGTITIPAMPDVNYVVLLTVNNNGSTSAANLFATVNGSLSTTSIPYTLTCTFNCSNVPVPIVYVHAHHN